MIMEKMERFEHIREHFREDYSGVYCVLGSAGVSPRGQLLIIHIYRRTIMCNKNTAYITVKEMLEGNILLGLPQINISRSTAKRELKKLEGAGWLSRKIRVDGAGYYYKVNIDEIYYAWDCLQRCII